MFFLSQRSSVTRYGQLDDASHLVLDLEMNDAHQQPTFLDIQVFIKYSPSLCDFALYLPMFDIFVSLHSLFCCPFVILLLHSIFLMLFLEPHWGFPPSIASAICMKTLEARATLKFALDIISRNWHFSGLLLFSSAGSWTLEFTQNHSKQQKNWIH